MVGVLEEERDGWTHLLPDVGCAVASSCFICPLPQCKYDDPAAYHLWLRQRRDRSIVEVVNYWEDRGAKRGLAIAITAGRRKVTESTVFRALARVRDGV